MVTRYVNNVMLLFINVLTNPLFSGSLIYRLRAVDPDGDTLKFGIRDQLGSNILRLEAISSNEANIYIVKELDREVRYLLKFLFIMYLPTYYSLPISLLALSFCLPTMAQLCRY